MKFRYILAGVAAFAALLSCSKDGDGDGDSVKAAVLAVEAQMPEGVAEGIKSVDVIVKGDKLSVDAAGIAAEGDLLKFSATLPEGATVAEGTSLLVHFNAPETEHTVYTSYIELGADAFVDGKLGTVAIDATESASHAGLPTCDGTAENPYLLGDAYQIAAIASLLAEEGTTSFKMVADIDFGGLAWATVDTDGKSFAFDGDNHKISNVAAYRGLFAAVTGSVQNLTIDTAVLTADSNSVGVLADILDEESFVKNVTVLNSSISNTQAVNGGLVGHMSGGSIENSSADCEVAGAGYVGGLVGRIAEGAITNCSASGDVTTDYYYSGGLVGYVETAEVTLSGCSSSGKVYNGKTNYSRSGGLVGQMEGGKVENCFATGDSESLGVFNGGLIGRTKGVEVDGCYATGKVTSAHTGYSFVGGLIGQIEGGSVKNSYATGNVEAAGQGIGGLLGNVNTGTVVKCYATGNTSTKEKHYVGGLIGIIDNGATVEKSYATGNVGDDKANRRGGLIGNVSSGETSISNCYCSGAVTGANYNGGFIGGVETAAKLDVTCCYTKSEVSGGTWNSGVFAGSLAQDSYTCKGFIGWNVSNRRAWAYSVDIPADNYMGTSGTISFQAGKFMNTPYKWDPAIWDLNEDDPKLK